MTITDIRQKILEDDVFVLSEITKLQRLMELKHVIRFHLERNDELHTESVADHVYGMHVLVDYFLPLEDEAGEWDRTRIQNMVQWHDIDEIETGDVMGYLKTEADRAKEKAAEEKVLQEAPVVMQPAMETALQEYSLRETPESKFVKGIDKMDAAIQVFSDQGRKVIALHKTTFEENQRIKAPFVADFPYMKRFQSLMATTMKEAGFFAE